MSHDIKFVYITKHTLCTKVIPLIPWKGNKWRMAVTGYDGRSVLTPSLADNVIFRTDTQTIIIRVPFEWNHTIATFCLTLYGIYAEIMSSLDIIFKSGTIFKMIML